MPKVTPKNFKKYGIEYLDPVRSVEKIKVGDIYFYKDLNDDDVVDKFSFITRIGITDGGKRYFAYLQDETHHEIDIYAKSCFKKNGKLRNLETDAVVFSTS